MRVLGIDTATSVASVALVEDGVIIAEGSYPNRAPLSAKPTASQKSHHAEVILPLIEGVIAKAQATLEALSGVAVSIGPGSFTGVRLGLATVKGLTYGWDIPVAGISTLEANAARAADFEGVICSLIDARKNEVYAACFRRGFDGLVRLCDDFAGPVQAVVTQGHAFGAGGACMFFGEGVESCERQLRELLWPEARLDSGDRRPPMASAVALLGWERLRNAGGDDPWTLAPIYLPSAQAAATLHNPV